MARAIRPWLACLGLLLLPSLALAWGNEGHETVAAVAETFLTPQARRQVTQLLAADPTDHDMVAASTWADRIRHAQPQTAPWHFVDIPFDAPSGFDQARDCATDRCIVAVLQHQIATLGDRRQPARQRAEALKWVIHLVGDLHQPLHAAERNHDRGGNEVWVIFNGHKQRLHAVWDSGLVLVIDDHHTSLPTTLAAKITAAQKADWSRGSITDWVNESWTIAHTFIYPRLGNAPADLTNPFALPANYDDDACPIVADRLSRAGLRLANILNATLH